MAGEGVTARAYDSPLVWAFAAMAAGGVAGVTATSDTSAPLLLVGLLALVSAGAIAVAVLAEPERGLWLILLAIPLDTAGRLITSPVTVTVMHLTLLLTLAAWAVRWVADPVDARPRWSALDIGIALLLAAAVWSLPGSLAPAATVVAIVRLLFMWLFFLLFVTWVRSERSIYRIVLLLIVTASLTAVVALAQSRFPDAGIGYVHTQIGAQGLTIRPAAFFDDPNYLGTLLSLGILAAIGMAISVRRLWQSILWLMPAALCSAGIIVTLSRTAWLGVFAGLGALILAAPKRRRRWLIAASIAIALSAMVMAPEATTQRLASIVDVDRDTSIRTRYLMFGSTVDMIADNWVFGTGLSAYEAAYPPYRRLGALIDILRPHQLPLALWAEMGLLGLFSQLFIIGGMVWMIRHRRHKGWNVYESIAVAGSLAMFVQSLFQYYLYFQYLWLFLALTVVATRMTDTAEEVSS